MQNALVFSICTKSGLNAERPQEQLPISLGDGSIYNGVWTTYSGRVAGPDDLLATGPTDVTPGTRGDAFYARKFGSAHTGVCNFVFCDGSVKAVRNTIDGVSLRRLAVRNDGEVTPSY